MVDLYATSHASSHLLQASKKQDPNTQMTKKNAMYYK